jgi:putative transposase
VAGRIDYPVKHGFVQQVEEWPWSTYHKYAKEGFYGRANDFEQIKNISIEGFGE